MYRQVTAPAVCRDDRLMIQSRGFDFSQGCAFGLFHTFPQTSDISERLLKGLDPKLPIYSALQYEDNYNKYCRVTRTANLDLSYSRLTDF